ADVRRHQVGGELDAREIGCEHLRERLDQQGLRQAAHTDDQRVAADEEREQHLVDHRILTDDALAQLGTDALRAVAHPLGKLDVVASEWCLLFRYDRCHRHACPLLLLSSASTCTARSSRRTCMPRWSGLPG